MNTSNFSRDDLILGGVAFLLLIDLLFLPWFSVGGTVTVGTTTFSVGGSLTATDAPDAFLGLLAVLALILLIADLLFERLSPQTQIPSIGGSRTVTRFVLAAGSAACLALKFLFQISHFGNLGFGFWAGLVLTVGLVYIAMQARNAAPLMPTRPAGPPAV